MAIYTYAQHVLSDLSVNSSTIRLCTTSPFPLNTPPRVPAVSSDARAGFLLAIKFSRTSAGRTSLGHLAYQPLSISVCVCVCICERCGGGVAGMRLSKQPLAPVRPRSVQPVASSRSRSTAPTAFDRLVRTVTSRTPRDNLIRASSIVVGCCPDRRSSCTP